MIDERAPDIVEALNDMPPELAVAVLLHLPPDRAVEVLDQPGLERKPELVTLMPREAAARLLSGVSADRVADIFHQIKEPHCSELLDLLDPDTRINIRRLLEYPKDTAGSIMTTEFVSVPSIYTVQQTLDYIRHVESSRETVYAIYVLDPLSKMLIKTISLRRLVSGDPEAPVLSVARPGRLITATPLMDREDVARLISKYDLLAVPVVDHGRVIGIVTVDDVIDAIVQESTEDVQKFGGMATTVHGGRLLADDEEARRLVVRAVPFRDADGVGDAGLRKRTREGDRVDAVHPVNYELGGQFRIAGHIPSNTRIGFA
jgi:magnesium transporter